MKNLNLDSGIHIERTYLVDWKSLRQLQQMFCIPMATDSERYNFHTADRDQYPRLKRCKLQISNDITSDEEKYLIKKYPNENWWCDIVVFKPNLTNTNCELRTLIELENSIYASIIRPTSQSIKNIWLIDR